jgi:Flp pilus assembly protein TadG
MADDQGSVMVEFAITAAAFFLILFGILEFGYAAWAKNSVTADAREGARYAMVHGSGSGRIADSAAVANYVKTKTSLGSSIQVSTTWTPNNDPESQVTVTVTKSQPRLGVFIPARVDSGTSTMLIIF